MSKPEFNLFPYTAADQAPRLPPSLQVEELMPRLSALASNLMQSQNLLTLLRKRIMSSLEMRNQAADGDGDEEGDEHDDDDDEDDDDDDDDNGGGARARIAIVDEDGSERRLMPAEIEEGQSVRCCRSAFE